MANWKPHFSRAAYYQFGVDDGEGKPEESDYPGSVRLVVVGCHPYPFKRA